MHSHHSAQDFSGLLASWLPLLHIVLAGGVYVAAVYKLYHRQQKWNPWRSASFCFGLLLLFCAMLPSVMAYAHHDLRGHMVQHLLLGMLAPLGLVLGTPFSLAFRVLPQQQAKRLASVLRSPFFHFLTHPLTAFALNMGGMAALYLTPLYAASLTNPLLHYLVHAHFLLAGYLFTWAMIGPDPAPARPSLRYRAMVLLLSMACHAFLSKFMYAYGWPRHTPHPEEQILRAAKIMYYGGDLSELLLTVALFAIWYQKRGLRFYRISPV